VPADVQQEVAELRVAAAPDEPQEQVSEPEAWPPEEQAVRHVPAAPCEPQEQVSEPVALTDGWAEACAPLPEPQRSEQAALVPVVLQDALHSALARHLCSCSQEADFPELGAHYPGPEFHSREPQAGSRQEHPLGVQTFHSPSADSSLAVLRPADCQSQPLAVSLPQEHPQAAHLSAQVQDCWRECWPVPPDSAAPQPTFQAADAADRSSPGVAAEPVWKPPAAEPPCAAVLLPEHAPRERPLSSEQPLQRS